MPAVLAFRNLVTAANLSSPQAFSSTLPLANAAKRQVSVIARRSAAGDTEYRIDLGEARSIGCLALLGHNHGEATGTVTYRYEASLIDFSDNSAYDDTDTTSPTFRASIQRPDYVHIPTVAIYARYIRISVSAATLSAPMDVGVIWVSEVFGQASNGPISAVPPIDVDWVLSWQDATQTDESRGGQAYARGSRRLRTLTCRYQNLTYAQVLGGIGFVSWDLVQIGEYSGSEHPCLMIARSDSAYVLHRTMVYGRQMLPWRVAHTAGGSTGAGLFGTDLEFREER